LLDRLRPCKKKIKRFSRSFLSLAAELRTRETNTFQAKQMALRQRVQLRESMLQGGDMQARQTVEQALTLIFQEILRIAVPTSSCKRAACSRPSLAPT
jgi:hypothetical protein